MNGKNNIAIGFLLMHFSGRLRSVKSISWLSLTGILMPLGILAELYLGATPIFVLIGAAAMTTAVIWRGISFFNMKHAHSA